MVVVGGVVDVVGGVLGRNSEIVREKEKKQLEWPFTRYILLFPILLVYLFAWLLVVCVVIPACFCCFVCLFVVVASPFLFLALL